MTAEIEDNEPVPKLTAKLRSEIMPPEPFEYTVLKPAEPIVENDSEGTRRETSLTSIEPEDEKRFEETIERVVAERKPQRQIASKPKRIRKTPTRAELQVTPISKLDSELRKHKDARRKTDQAILDIRKELKDLLLIHHAKIKDLQKQVTQMRRKIATIVSSKKSARVKITAKKTTRNKKTSSSKQSKKKSWKR